jgi:hypothetical protein
MSNINVNIVSFVKEFFYTKNSNKQEDEQPMTPAEVAKQRLKKDIKKSHKARNKNKKGGKK